MLYMLATSYAIAVNNMYVNVSEEHESSKADRMSADATTLSSNTRRPLTVSSAICVETHTHRHTGFGDFQSLLFLVLNIGK